ncbi:hypothetical protein [Streptomyces sp. NPDC057909]|uniref:hypothetical protein n=1 Tax=Streptomyces sp. NPDC057909 TaxID=3346277 RepID=UPI0036F07D5F
MTWYPGFGVLWRLVDHRKLDIGLLARQAGTQESELRAALSGVMPCSMLLRQLAPALGPQSADLLALAGIPIPEQRAPLGATAGQLIPQLVDHAVFLPPEGRSELLR